MNLRPILFIASALLASLTFTPSLLAQVPEEDTEELSPPDDVEVTDRGKPAKWFVYEAEESGVLMVFTHGANADLILAIYGENWSSGELGIIDSDIGSVGNEMIAYQVQRGQIYYIKIYPLGGSGLPRRFKVMSAFVPGDHFKNPFCDG